MGNGKSSKRILNMKKGPVGPGIFKKYDLVITYQKSNIDYKRISGHFFEAFDYLVHLKTKDPSKNIAILIQDDLDLNQIKIAFEDKYLEPDFTIDVFIDFGIKNLIAKNILHCSGLSKTDECNYIGNIFSFRCGLEPLDGIEYTLLQDNRIYTEDYGFSTPESPKIINYIKKVAFGNYRTPENNSNPNKTRILIYDNTRCRELNEQLESKITEVLKFRERIDPDVNYELIKVGSDIKLPVNNFLGQFDEYWYTPTKNNFDCSPRLILECFLFGIPVKYLLTTEYLEKDPGLKFRILDLNLNYKKLILDDSDPIYDIIFNNSKTGDNYAF